MTIIANNVSFSFGRLCVLESLNFQIEAGQFVGIFGPNGGGKTTLLQLIMGFLTPDEGSFSIFGNTPIEARKDMAYVPQIALFDKQFPLSVMDIVLMGELREANWFGKLPEKSIERAKEALELVGLESKQENSFGSLSGGEAQRVLIARALVSKPKLLLLDEPTASVDAKTEQALYDILMQLKGSTTILMVSHDLPAMTKRVDTCLLVRRQVTGLKPDALCDHYAMGLYHPPITLGTKT